MEKKRDNRILHPINWCLGRIFAWYLIQQRAVNWFLVGLIGILLLGMLGRYMVAKYIPMDVVEFGKVTGIFRDVVSVVALSVVGMWSYYVFIRVRTFEPRARLKIELRETSATHSVAVLRFTVTNIGKTKLSSLRGQVRYFVGQGIPDGVIFIPMFLDADILRHYRETGEALILEPGDEINIDTPVVIKDLTRALLLVKSVFEINEGRVYEENAIFCLDNIRDTL